MCLNWRKTEQICGKEKGDYIKVKEKAWKIKIRGRDGKTRGSSSSEVGRKQDEKVGER